MTRRASLVLPLVAALAACRERPAEFRIGVLATFTGPFAEASGIPTRQGAMLAVREAGGAIEIGGRRHRITLVERDFEDRADAAASAARELINQERVVALVGPQFSRHAIPVSVVAEQSAVPMISPMSSSPVITAGKRFVFRLAFLDDVQGDALARFARDDLGAGRAAVLYDVSATYSRDLAERFRDRFTALGGRVVGFEWYTADRKDDVRPQLRRLAALGPDVLLLPNFPDALPAQLRQLAELRLRATILGCDSWDLPSLETLPPGTRAFVTSQWRPDLPTDATDHFAAAFRAAYRAEPRSTAAMTYDAVRLLLDAARRAGGLEPERIRDALLATRAFPGASGALTFDGRPDPVRDVAVSEVRDRRLVTVRLVMP